MPVQDRERFHRAIAELYNPDPVARRRMVQAAERAKAERDDAVLQETGIRMLRRKPVFNTPNIFPPENFAQQGTGAGGGSLRSIATSASRSSRRSIISTIRCVLRARSSTSRKRTELADLRGRVALLTGGRVKIGYQAGLKLLRAGAELIVTTRFPRDSAQRYAQETDFGEWGDRLEIFGLDLRHTPSVEAFCTAFARDAAAAGLHCQ